MAWQIIHTRYGIKCPKCGENVKSGERVAYNRLGEKGQKAFCLKCHNANEMQQQQATPATTGGTCRGFEKHSDGIWRATFNSVGEEVEFATKLGTLADPQNQYKVTQREGEAIKGGSWYNGFNLAKCVEFIKNPPSDFATKISELKNELEGRVDMPVRTRRRVRRNQEDGEELDPVAVRQNRLNAWSDIHHERAPKNVIRIGVNMASHCERAPQELYYRGAATAALADLLTEQGYSVEIIALHSVYKISRSIHMSVTKTIVKSADMPLDINTVAFCLSEIGYYRCVCITANGRLCVGKLACNFGVPVTLPVKDGAELDILLDSDLTTKEQAIEAIKRYVNRADLVDMAA